MDAKEELRLSKFLSLVLRHAPEKFGVQLIEGFCNIENLLKAINAQSNFNNITYENIKQVVNNCPKQRYMIDGLDIKANYGHSIVRLEYESSCPPKILYHGTNTKAIDIILEDGLRPMGRQYIHLSEGTGFATLAGQRRGNLVLVTVNALDAYEEGVKFYYAYNDVWLADYIPPQFLSMK